MVTLERARRISAAVPPFVTRVAVFVNASGGEVEAVIRGCRPDLLQFHGEEPPEFCRAFGVPYLRAVRVKRGFDLLEYLSPFHDAAGWLLDAYRDDLYGGTGEAFDWGLVPQRLARPVVLSGGIDAANVGDAVRTVRPWAVDVSTGVESAKGVKDERLIAALIAGVRNADA